MPIPTRARSIKTASRAPHTSPQHGEARSTAAADAKVDSQSQNHPSLLPQPQRESSVISHHRSHSTTTSGIPHPQTGSVATAVAQKVGTRRPPSLTARESDQRSASTVKPSFNTYQQHYSPQKLRPLLELPPKKANPRERSNADPREATYVSRLQDELLQLSLVHRRSAQTLNNFERDVKVKLGLRTIELRQEQVAVANLEAEYQQKLDALALLNWLQDEKAGTKERKVQDLSFCINELATLSREGRLFEQVMTEYSQWLAKAQRVMARLSMNTMLLGKADDDMLFLDPPETPWRRGIDECSTRLELCQKLLMGLGDAEPDTGIGIVLGRHQQLATVLLDKLRTAQDIIDVVIAFQEQFRSHALSAALNIAAAEERNDQRKGIWSMLEHD